MIKNKKVTVNAPVHDEQIQAIASLLTNAKDSEKAGLEQRIESLVDNIQQYERDIERSEMYLNRYNSEKVALIKALRELPEETRISDEVARAQAEAILKLSYIKNVSVEEMGGEEYIVIQTRENSMFTTLKKKFSRSQRWYRVKPYRVSLPAYTIRIAIGTRGNYSNNSEALGIKITNEDDYSHFSEAVQIYSHQPHPHWASLGSRGEYTGLCLGDYTSEIAIGIRNNLYKGVIAIATYLQISGATSAYITERERWALYLGNKEYNALLIPSVKEEEAIKPEDIEEDEDERTLTCAEDDCEMCEDNECACSCHND
jgi:hypothetical protein